MKQRSMLSAICFIKKLERFEMYNIKACVYIPLPMRPCSAAPIVLITDDVYSQCRPTIHIDG